MTDVVVLEQSQLTSGSTWHAAGLVAAADVRTESDLAIYTYGRDLYGRLEAETGLSTGFRDVGYMHVVTNEERLHELRRVAAFQRRHNVDLNEISPKEAEALFPHADFSDVIAAFYVANDGRINPVDMTMSLAKGARMGGAKIFEGVGVSEILTKNGTAIGVRTTGGDVIHAENVVICAGMWARQLGASAGLNLPLQAAEHYYIITDDMGLSRDLPVLEDSAAYTYYREEGGGMMLGLFEPDDAVPWNLKHIPENFSFGELNPDMDRILAHLETSYKRVPDALNAGVRKFFCGPESFTPDLAPLVGETPELRKCFVAAGLNSSGILNGAGIAMVLAHWIVDGLPPLDVTGINVNRFSRDENTPAYRRDRTPELLGKMFGQKFPNKGMQTARNAKQTVLYERLKAAGAFFVEDHGWEVADWYAPSPEEAKVERYSWHRQNWWPYLEAECKAARNDVILMDMSDMNKFLVQGRDALALLNRLSCNDIDMKPGRLAYTQWTNARGGIEGDLTITRLEEGKFIVVCGPNARGHTQMRLNRHIGPDEFVTVTDISAGITQLNIHGPKARALMEKLTDYDMSHENFPFANARTIDIGYAQVLAQRVTYVGELGWELNIPAVSAVQIYDMIIKAGKEFGLRHAGLQALMSLRMEKGYREYGHDLDNTDTPIEAGLGFVVKLDKPGGFIGRDVLAAQKEAGIPHKRLLQFILDDPQPLLYGGELIYMDGEYVGYLGSGAYGFTLGAAVGLGYAQLDKPVSLKRIKAAQWEIEIADKRYAAKASLKPLFDPSSERIRA